MSDLKPGDKISTIPFDAIIKVPISGAFYSRMQQVFFTLMEEKRKDDPTGQATNTILKELETREPANLWEVQVTILLALLFAVETAGKEQKVLVSKEALDFIPKDPSQEASPEN